MVRRWAWSAVAAVLSAAPAIAGPDWRAAGGSIFVEKAGAAAALADTSAGPAVDAAVTLPASGQPFEAVVAEAAARHRLDPKLLHALVTVESSYRPGAVSPAGAAGLTQLMPATANELGVADRFDARANLAGGADYLARQIVRFGDLKLALAAYNAGPERVARLGRIPRIAETQQYVARVLTCYLALAAGRAVRTAADCGNAAP